jgi:hypothetical protein
MGNPGVVAITNLLHNKQGFMLVAGVNDLFVVSIGSGSSACAATITSSTGWQMPKLHHVDRDLRGVVGVFVEQGRGRPLLHRP